jgi:hypothetical protein
LKPWPLLAPLGLLAANGCLIGFDDFDVVDDLGAAGSAKSASMISEHDSRTAFLALLGRGRKRLPGRERSARQIPPFSGGLERPLPRLLRSRGGAPSPKNDRESRSVIWHGLREHDGHTSVERQTSKTVGAA